MIKWAKIKKEDNMVTDLIVSDNFNIELIKNSFPDYNFVQSIDSNEAYIGYPYSNSLEKFAHPSIFPSWIWNEEIYTWEPPTPMPTSGGKWDWDEDLQVWFEVPEIQYLDGSPHQQ